MNLPLLRRAVGAAGLVVLLGSGLAACGGDDADGGGEDGADAGAQESTSETSATGATETPEATAAAETSDATDATNAATNAAEPGPPGTIDCDAIDVDAMLAITGSELVEMQQMTLFDGYQHSLGERKFSGSSSGCDVDLDYGEFGPPELDIGVLMMEDGFFDFFRTSAETEDGYAEVPDVGDDAFVYQVGNSRTQLVTMIGDTVVTVSFARNLGDPAPEVDEVLGLWELIEPALGG